MTTVLKKIAKDALVLSVKERARLARILISSLDKDTQQDVYSEWDAELAKRVQDIREGKVKGVPAEEVFAKLKEKYY